MTWVKLDDSFADDPRWDTVGSHGMRLHLAALGFCSRNLTDGRIQHARALLLAAVPTPAKHVQALVQAGFWTQVEGGYEVVGYLLDQPSRAEVEEMRRKKTQRQRSWRASQQRAKGPQKKTDVDARVDRLQGRLVDGRVDVPVDGAPPRPAPKEGGSGPAAPPASAAARCADGACDGTGWIAGTDGRERKCQDFTWHSTRATDQRRLTA